MAVEIERKFLVVGEAWRELADAGRQVTQAYLSDSEKSSIRIRIIDGKRAFLSIKSGYRGITRDEFEYEIPVRDAEEMLALRQSGIVDKIRHHLLIAGVVWEVDVFSGENAGLVIAEVELEDENQKLTLPSWIGQEVTGDLRYQNSMLAKSPYGTWGLSE
jgi:adenylate cyclase